MEKEPKLNWVITQEEKVVNGIRRTHKLNLDPVLLKDTWLEEVNAIFYSTVPFEEDPKFNELMPVIEQKIAAIQCDIESRITEGLDYQHPLYQLINS